MKYFLARLLYYYFCFWGFLLKALPFFLLESLATVLSYFWFYIVGFRKAVIQTNLKLVFADKSQKEIKHITRLNMRHVLLLIFEFWMLFVWNRKDLDKKVKITGLEHLQERIKKKQGCFLLTAHIGNWELLLMCAQLLGLPLSYFARDMRNSFWDEVLSKWRSDLGMEKLSESKSSLKALRAFRRGNAIGFMFDQHTGEPHGVLSEFMGKKAWTAKGLAILSQRLKAPVFPVHLIRLPGGRYHLKMEAALDFEAGTEVQAKFENSEYFQSHILSCNKKIEEWVRQTPEQYLWMHKRFKANFDYSKKL